MNPKPFAYASLRVLVIEDEAYTRKLICGLLRQLGFRQIEEAADGAAGMLEFRRTSPDLVLCDVHMEPVDGLAFLTEVRSLGNGQARTPIIFLTADSQEETVIAAKSLEVNGYLVKPISPAMLQAKLATIMARYV